MSRYLTEKQIKNLKPRNKQYEIQDKGGVSIRVSPTGQIIFSHRFSFEKKEFRNTFGFFPFISIAKAREMVREDYEMIYKGINPAVHKRDNKRDKSNVPTVSEFTYEYKKKYLDKNLKNPGKPFRLLEKDVFPEIGEYKITDVNRRDLIFILDKIVERGSPIQANRTLSAIKGLFKFAIERGVLGDDQVDPAGRITKKAVGGKENSRDRVLSNDEVKDFWEKLETAGFTDQVKSVFRILLLTGLRASEVCGGFWSEVDLENRLFTIQPNRLKDTKKTGREPHKVFLTETVIEEFKKLKKYAKDSPFIAQSPQNRGHQHIVHTTLSRAITRYKDHFGIEKFTPHDLRRTFSTRLNELGVAPYVVEKCLDHKMEGVMAVYNRAEYLEERQIALERWESEIKRILKGDTEETPDKEPAANNVFSIFRKKQA